TAGPDPSGAQLPRAVSYQIVRRPITASPDAEIRYMLYRTAANAQSTLSVGYHLGNFSTASPPTSADLYNVNINLNPPVGNPYYQSSPAASTANGDPAYGSPESIRRP